MVNNTKPYALERPLILGTYTSAEPDASKGIYGLADLDAGPYLLGKQPNPTYVIKHPTHEHLFYGISRGHDDPTNSIYVWRFEPDDTGAPQPADEPLSYMQLKGEGACHLAIQGKLLVTANYGGGSADVVLLDDAGLPVRQLALIKHEGSGPREDRQDAAHVHWAGFTRDGTRLLLTDLGTDEVVAYSASELEALADTEQAIKTDVRPMQKLQFPGGEGPRHIALASNEDLYVLTELGHKVFHVKDDGKQLTIVSDYATLPEDQMMDRDNTSSAISLSPDERSLLVSERGVERLVTFRRDPADGSLTEVSNVSSGSTQPREAQILPDGRTVAAGHQSGSELVLFPLDPETSELGEALARVPLSKVVCVLAY